MYEFLSHKLASLPDRRLSVEGLHPAAVLLAITNAEHPEIILTQRSMHLPTHQGQVAFPGGKCDAEDIDEVATALREAHEEVALLPEQVRVVGSLGQVYSRHGFVVTPIVGVIEPEVLTDLQANLDELDVVFSVPVEFFLTHKPYMRHVEMVPGHYQVPTFEYGDFTIWGMTAFVLAEFFNHVYDAGFPLQKKP
ncbi:MAG: CoA pyrophosphatase [Gammaproteobacteria bacterium]|mgnify:CR=1 FL=1|jgi:8-oxo-dGTP pyrophosphatase MutT (NUDIX family)|nr:CoA pyrophosphatase [Gammaproteobacteria bacterium]MCP4879737.1 CoA pyrophosphatase [Gammaproteobacteria bacterium]MDP6164975.1 CoA pyrophosphatase [Gammaproteobacteria bacterium]